MNKAITFRHYCGIEYHNLESSEVQKILDATQGEVLRDCHLYLTSEWKYDEVTGKKIGRKSTYTIRISSRNHYTGSNEEELSKWEEAQTKMCEEINRIIEEQM